jgi:hypothetical protein
VKYSKTAYGSKECMSACPDLFEVRSVPKPSRSLHSPGVDADVAAAGRGERLSVPAAPSIDQP